MKHKRDPGHVVHVIDNLSIGGAERLVVLLASAQRRLGLEAEVCALTDPTPLAATLADHGVPFNRLHPGSSNDPRAVTRLWRFFRSTRPDIVHTHLFYADVFGRIAARLARVPIVVSTEHSTDPSRMSLRRRASIRGTAPLVSRVVAVSGAVEVAIRRRAGISAAKVEVIPNGIEVERWTGAAPADRRSLGVEPDAVLLGVVGRLDAAKAHDVLIDAVAAWGDPSVRVVVVGDGPLRAELEARAASRGVGERFLWLGVRSDVPAILAALDIYVQPSRFEGHSMALLEAMASGCACVTSDVPEIEAVLGTAGVRSRTGDARSLATELARLAADPDERRRLGAEARRRACRFSIETSAERYADLYARLASERGLAWR